MPTATKIATCCYCGTRAALVLRGETRHELSCASCGAPLHEMKLLKGAARPVHAPDRAPHPQRHPGPKRPKKRKRKSLSRKLLSEAFDLIEDIFD
ncbi:hypothetical protein DKT77_16115 [Meridianimarinicoccus roseus]|jgi:hypothetical protein|uniref:Uncharacterized protein n=1 Tax=Meridianimarinicoccus roseus TaxID=2072018 RepID=A0A2V2LD02_9RHOB|nr:hypothetical protein [Meridianimarinicoccus roseus]PWR01651.1 hypothetical protein DKT77_16115 [Meridianimarinicoccus roseus]